MEPAILPNQKQAPTSLEEIQFDDKAKAPEKTAAPRLISDSVFKAVPWRTPSISHFALLMVGYWGFRSLKTMHRFLGQRYSDIPYQIRRPDSIANRIVAFKRLAVGGSVIPLAVMFGLWVSSGETKHTHTAEHTESDDGLVPPPAISRLAEGTHFTVPSPAGNWLRNRFCTARHNVSDWLDQAGLGKASNNAFLKDWARFCKAMHLGSADNFVQHTGIGSAFFRKD
eukprot:GDKI01001273.1.p1 GENE.GDKI01001273.1~~GDKI01001273.1.p1  ORF type:complete len:226 (-),score=27.30 GDKI01001273.1:128-805(-)